MIFDPRNGVMQILVGGGRAGLSTAAETHISSKSRDKGVEDPAGQVCVAAEAVTKQSSCVAVRAQSQSLHSEGVVVARRCGAYGRRGARFWRPRGRCLAGGSPRPCRALTNLP